MNLMLTLLQAADAAAPNSGAGGEGGGGSTLAPYLMVAGIALLIFVLWHNVRKRVSRHADLDPREKVERDKQVNGMKNDLRTMMVELDELTRRFGAQLDAKAMKLERLIEQADERIAKLNGSPAEAEIERPREAAGSGPPAGPEPPDPLADNVYRLADAGKDTGKIARQLNEHIGKVELILALRQQA